MIANLKAMWEPGVKNLYKGKDAQAVADEIYSIGDNPTKAEIVDKARDESTELHSLFEWRDDVAAEKWREEQAGTIMRHLKVVFVHDEREKPESEIVFKNAVITDEPFRMFFGDPQKKSGFVSVMKVMSDQETYNALLQRAKDEMAAFERKYCILKELQPLFEAMHQIL